MSSSHLSTFPSSKRSRFEEIQDQPSYFAFVCDENDISVKQLPESLKSRVVVGNKIEKFGDAANIISVIWKPPGKPSVVKELFEKIKETQGNYPPWLHSFFAGVDGLSSFLSQIDPDITKTTNGRGAFSSSLAEFSLAAMLYFNKQIPRLESNFKDRKWDPFVMNTLKHSTIGFLGWGSIAQTTADLLLPFQVNLICYRRRKNLLDENPRVKFVQSKFDIAKQSDFIVNTLPATKETLNFVDDEFLNSMKKTGIFINVGRGSTVDEDALVMALKEDKILGAYLDVYKKEPLEGNHPFFTCNQSKLLLSSHNADNTFDYIPLGWKIFEENYSCFLNDFKPNSETGFKPTFFDPKTGY